jgi:hypothetical protein
MVTLNYRWKASVYVVSPIDVVAIGGIPHPRKKRKVQMIVGVDEARKNQVPVQVYVFGPGRRIGECGREVEDTGYAIASDLD